MLSTSSEFCIRGVRCALVLAQLVSLGAVASCSPADPGASEKSSKVEAPTEKVGQAREALAGVDGAVTIPAAGTVVNRYTSLFANASAGASTVRVVSVAALAVGADALAPGDLVLIAQMQGATISTTTPTSTTWGSITSVGGAGLYEMAEVLSVDAGTNTITFSCNLRNAYETAGATQVVRVPQYDSLTIAAGASITAPAWDGITGGIVAIDAKSTVTLTGDIDVTARGFRGGLPDDASDDVDNDTAAYASQNPNGGGSKGEGIAGLRPEFGRGPAANGGGGGNAHNAGGGGGSNGKSGGAWTGQGTFNTAVVGGVLAWALDPNFSATASEGGGRGGYTYSGNDLIAIVFGPNSPLWGGNWRRERGGLGGHALDNDATTRVFLGGGGGAGDGNNMHAGRGGNGGGLVVVRAATVTGAGRILANGEAGVNSDSTTQAANGDAPGGGGAGGGIVVRATSVSGITVRAGGGAGGNQIVGNGDEAEGPGGGGGGGFVSVSGTVAGVTVAGGSSGTTTSAAMTEFPSNGATFGTAGLAQTGAAATGTIPYCADTTVPDTVIATGPSGSVSDGAGDFTFSSPDPTATFECRVDAGTFAACPTPFATAALADGSHTLEVRAKDPVGNLDPTPASRTWIVDTIAPDTTLLTGPSGSVSTPVNAFTFSSPDAAATFECRLDGGTFASCTTPFTTASLADGSHTFEVRARDLAGNTDATPASRTWIVDATAPDTTLLTGPSGPTPESTPTFTFSSPDGTAAFECSVDGVTFSACITPFTTAPLADGAHTFAVRARDAAGNIDATPATSSFTVDTAVPETAIVTGPSGTVADPTGDFTFTSPDPTADFECRIDGASFAPCASPFTTNALADGAHTFEVSARDPAGNVDPTPATRTWTIDTTAPDTTILTGPSGTVTSDTADFGFSSPDATATFECSIDNAAFAPCTSPLTTATLADGQHTFAVRALDVAGNVDATPATRTWTIDTTAPDTVIDSGPSGSVSATTAAFTFSTPDTGATFECSIDGATFATCTTPFTTAVLPEGQHTFAVRARDAAGNVDATPATRTWTIDTTAPDTAIVTGPNGTVADDTADFTFSSPDATATFECRLDGGPFAACATPFASPPLSDGSHTLDVRAKDAAGNVDPVPATRTWTLDTVGPDTVIVSSPTSPTDDTTGDFTFTSTDALATFECSVDNAVFAPCATPFVTVVLPAGTHSFRVRAADALGNVDSTPAQTSWTIGALDSDHDGVSDPDEIAVHTDPNDADTDDDGVTDGAEIDRTQDTDGDGLINALDPDSDNDGLFDGTELGRSCTNPATDISRALCRPDADPTTTTSPVNADTDGGGVRDGSEDANLNGRVDTGEADPTAGHRGDDSTVADTDADGVSDALEATLRSNPADVDSDDDGLPDGQEPNPSADGDRDGLIDIRDVDSDDDGLFDGTERGKGCTGPGTNAALNHCLADADPTTNTSAVNVDTDYGGVSDGNEDVDLDGAYTSGSESNPVAGQGGDDGTLTGRDADGDGISNATEGAIGSDPNDADSDDDGLPDGAEPNPTDDHDGDGEPNITDPDSDGDGLFDGTEAGRGCSGAGTDVAQNRCIADADPTTKTYVVVRDTDNGGVIDGTEDTNHDGRVDRRERNPRNPADDNTVIDGGVDGDAGDDASAGSPGSGGSAGGASSGGSANGGSAASGGSAATGGSATGGTGTGGSAAGGTGTGGSAGEPGTGGSGASTSHDDGTLAGGGFDCALERRSSKGGWPLMLALDLALAARRRRRAASAR